MFYSSIPGVINRLGLSPIEKSIILEVWFWDGDGCGLSVNSLAEYIGTTPKSIRSAKSRLIRLKYLSEKAKVGRPSVLKVNKVLFEKLQQQYVDDRLTPGEFESGSRPTPLEFESRLSVIGDNLNSNLDNHNTSQTDETPVEIESPLEIESGLPNIPIEKLTLADLVAEFKRTVNPGWIYPSFYSKLEKAFLSYGPDIFFEKLVWCQATMDAVPDKTFTAIQWLSAIEKGAKTKSKAEQSSTSGPTRSDDNQGFYI